MIKFAVFGNPIYHSKSPFIYNVFAKQIGINCDYQCICPPINSFNNAISDFFAKGGLGANITLPFKQEALSFANKFSERALSAGAVNTLKKNKDGKIFGDNTDGIGLLSDLKRLSIINANSNVLLIGAGGAARGVILPLMLSGAILTITNRTISKVEKLTYQFQSNGNISFCSFSELNNKKFDLIINATSSSLNNQTLLLPNSLIHKKIYCYDMFYQKGLTSFLFWCKQLGAHNLFNGLGMLVYQAAHSFHLWHGIMPKVNDILFYLNKEYI
ncbi:MAG: shikimate dehydrogenase [Pantoea sp. Brub]|nr:shikimate dehydrogenase [Pantoea sp. Brub]